MAQIKLTPTSYVVLGLIALNGPSTPYDLKRAAALTVANVWSFPHAQLYSEPARLARSGLLHEQRETGGRHRRYFSITPAGRSALKTWLATPAPESRELREPGFLRLFFADLLDRDEVIALARRQEAAHRGRLEALEADAARLGMGRSWKVSLGPLQMGLIYERAVIGFWQDIARRARSGSSRA